jgi:hypothetical protein
MLFSAVDRDVLEEYTVTVVEELKQEAGWSVTRLTPEDGTF